MPLTSPATGRSLTLFYTDKIELQTLQPVADVAGERGYEVSFSDDLGRSADIGIYCSHRPNPANSRFSVIMLHDMAQRHDVWPDFWKTEPWRDFDIGVLPGRAWAERWSAVSWRNEARPRSGAFDLGWPKADLVFRDAERFRVESEKLRQGLGLKHQRSILYAPSWENDGKQDEFVRACRDLPVNLLLKQAPWSAAYPGQLENIRAMNALHRQCADNVFVVDANVSIMYCLRLADAIVSDESSVLIEALLLGVPGIAVLDWMIPDRDPPRPACVPYDFVTKTTRVGLREAVAEVLAQGDVARDRTVQLRDHHFSNLGSSAQRIMDVIEAALAGRPLPVQPLQARQLEHRHYRVVQVGNQQG